MNEFNKNCSEIPKIHLEQILVQTVKTSSGLLLKMLTKLIWETRIWQHALTELWLELWIQLIKILLVVLVMQGMLTGKRSKLYKGRLKPLFRISFNILFKIHIKNSCNKINE